jgi:hypothetical protein
MDPMARAARDDQPIRITTASTSRDADIAQRQKRYLQAMAIRVVCFIGAVAAGLAHINWLWPICVAGALVIPYLAVVAANAANTKGDGFQLRDSPFGDPELRGGKEWRQQHDQDR